MDAFVIDPRHPLGGREFEVAEPLPAAPMRDKTAGLGNNSVLTSANIDSGMALSKLSPTVAIEAVTPSSSRRSV